MRKYFLELFAIGLVDSEGRINTEWIVWFWKQQWR